MKNKLALLTLTAGLLAFGCGGGDDDSAINPVPTNTITPTPTVSPAPTGRIFFVRNTQSPTGDGTQNNPFATLAEAVSAATQDGDTIFVFRGDGTSNNLSTNFVLRTGQRLIGEGVGLAEPAIPSGQHPAVTGTIQVTSHCTVSGLNITNVKDPIYGAILDSSTITNNFINTTDGSGITLDGAIGKVEIANNIVDFESPADPSRAGIAVNSLTSLTGGSFTLSLGAAELNIHDNIIDGNNNAATGIFAVPFLVSLSENQPTTSTIRNNSIHNITSSGGGGGLTGFGALTVVSGLSVSPSTLNVENNAVVANGDSAGILAGNLIPIQIGGLVANTNVRGNNVITGDSPSIVVASSAVVENNQIQMLGTTSPALLVGIPVSGGFGSGGQGNFIVRNNVINAQATGAVVSASGSGGVVQFVDNQFVQATTVVAFQVANDTGIAGLAIRRNIWPAGNTGAFAVQMGGDGTLQSEITDNTAQTIDLQNGGAGIFQVENLAGLAAANAGATVNVGAGVTEGSSNLP